MSMAIIATMLVAASCACNSNSQNESCCKEKKECCQTKSACEKKECCDKKAECDKKECCEKKADCQQKACCKPCDSTSTDCCKK